VPIKKEGDKMDRIDKSILFIGGLAIGIWFKEAVNSLAVFYPFIGGFAVGAVVVFILGYLQLEKNEDKQVIE
jgi:ABC-type Mn2+/Zn2+ transport system permease subunit